METGSLAWLAMALWLPVSLALIARFPPPLAVSSALVGACLLLPAGSIDLPLFPPMTRITLPALAAFVALLILKRPVFRMSGLSAPLRALLGAIILASLFAVFANGDSLRFGPKYIPGLKLWDAFSMAGRQILGIAIPFLLGFWCFRNPRHLRTLLVVLMLAGLAYSVLVLFEVRMSPRLHKLIYGFRQHSFAQTFRMGGWRPMVFMSHGLQLALFMLLAAQAACTLIRIPRRESPVSAKLSAAYLVVVLALCKSLGSMVYGVVAIPIVLFAEAKLQVRLAALCGVLVLVYPMARLTNLFPTESLVELAEGISEERAASLTFRFDQEEQLMHRARERLWTGWGSWGRNQVYDLETGELISVADGRWILLLGSFGVIFMFVVPVLQLYPVFLAQRRFRRIRDRSDRLVVAGVVWLVAVSALDQLPNAVGTSVLTHFIPGALAGALTPFRRRRKIEGSRRPSGVDQASQRDGQPHIQPGRG